MKNNIKQTILLLLIVSLGSCVSPKKIAYFQNDEINQEINSNNFVTYFKPDDLLQIVISAQDMQSVLPFNLPSAVSQTSNDGSTQQGQQQSYLVDSKGYIDFPILGKLLLAGKTKEEVIAMFKERLDPDYVKNPTVNIFISNFSVTVAGDVANPGVFTIPNERITIIEALGLAGDTNISGRRENVKVIREENGKKNVYTIDLRSNTLFNSPIYYLQQNDLIYVEPNYAKSQSAASNPNTFLYIGGATLLISLITLITR